MSIHNPNERTAATPRHPRQNLATDAQVGDDVMTLAQASYLMMLCEETGQALDDSLSRSEAARVIAELELATGRGPGA